MAALVLTFRPHWLNGWRLRSMSTPYAEIDGLEWECSWRSPTSITLTPGTHTVRTFWRDTTRLTGDGGAGQASFILTDGRPLDVVARNRATTDSPFVPRFIPEPRRRR